MLVQLHRDASSNVVRLQQPHHTDLDTWFIFFPCLLALLENILGANFSGLLEEKRLLQMS